MHSHKKITDLFVLEQLQEKDVVGGFSNAISIAKKKPIHSHLTRKSRHKYRNKWFLKRDTEESAAQREVVAQELFRLFISSHPKTRLVEDESGDKSYIISKAVPGYCSLAFLKETMPIKNKVKDGTYQGLGEILVMALFVNEIDLRTPNLCLDDQDHIIKIDGDLCFARLNPEYKGGNYDITESDIQKLPHLGYYRPSNWLDLIGNGDSISQYIPKRVTDEDMSTNLFFRAEVNRTMLKIILLPNRMIRNFIHAYVCTETEAEVFYNEIIARKAEINNAATRNFAFCDYLKTETAKQDLKNFIGDLYQFKTTGKNHLWRNESDKKNMYAQLDQLRNDIENADLREPHTGFLGTFFNYLTGNRNDNASETIKRLMY